MRPFFKARLVTRRRECSFSAAIPKNLKGLFGGIEILYRLIFGIEKAEPAGGLASVFQGTPDGAVVGIPSEVEALDLSPAGIQDGKEGLLCFFFNVYHGLELALFLALSQAYEVRIFVSTSLSALAGVAKWQTQGT
jgi:hypothetical protein